MDTFYSDCRGFTGWPLSDSECCSITEWPLSDSDCHGVTEWPLSDSDCRGTLYSLYCAYFLHFCFDGRLDFGSNRISYWSLLYFLQIRPNKRIAVFTVIHLETF